MSNPMKKHKKKVSSSAKDGASNSSSELFRNFDYGSLIPKDVDPKTREIMEKFFRNEALDLNEKTEAFDNFLLAVRKEQDEVEKGEREAEAAKEASVQKQMETFGFVPHPNHLSEDRQRINVGWMTSRVDCDDAVDEKIATFCQRLGCLMYNFVSYPIGGVKRGFWTPEKNESGCYVAPQIWLPDVQLQNHLWETYVNGSISSWIDCDSSDEDFALFSAQELRKELNYAIYLGMRSIVITLRHSKSPKLVEIVNKWLWTTKSHTAIWIFIPTSPERFDDNDENKECWEVWADFRTQCANFGPHRLNVGLVLGDDIDDEFIDGRLDRWLAEPVGVFMVEASAFTTGDDPSEVYLCPPHEALLQRLWTTDTLRILVQGTHNVESSDEHKLAFVNACREAVKYVEKKPKMGFLQNVNFFDVLQTPLQPLADNLDSGIYNTFEQDKVKYESYQSAIEAALVDLADTRDKPETLVLYVLGAGRGPLMNAAIQAERKFNEQYRSKKNRLRMQLFVVEKNPNALTTLHYVNKVGWKGRVKIIEGDMRKLNENEDFLACPKPDIIVSELLGSFGDNELSPECLDGITFFLKPTTVCIPYSYTSYVAPIMSCYLHQNIQALTRGHWNKGFPGVGREELTRENDGSFTHTFLTNRVDSNLDQLYIVFLRHFCPLSDTQPVFTFDHPKPEDQSNQREARIAFDNFSMSSEMMGFAGYFSLKLYKDIMISIEPSTHTHQMYSWFPAVIPLRHMERIYPGDQVTLDIKRKVDSGGVWYEWFVEIKSKDGNSRKTVVQNENGINNYLRFFDAPVSENT